MFQVFGLWRGHNRQMAVRESPYPVKRQDEHQYRKFLAISAKRFVKSKQLPNHRPDG
jgi:hypothetical protein